MEKNLDDILSFIRICVNARRIFWTYHVNMRFAEREIKREAVLESTGAFEIIESYPKDKYLPSYLVLTRHDGAPYHVLFAIDRDNENVRVVTAYRPDPAEWSDDFKRRKQKWQQYGSQWKLGKGSKSLSLTDMELKEPCLLLLKKQLNFIRRWIKCKLTKPFTYFNKTLMTQVP